MSTEDPVREERIANEILVDSYTESDRALSWYYYLEENLSFPFKGTCINTAHTSPLKDGKEVQVLAMATADECLQDMYVQVQHGLQTLSVPLQQLRCHSRSRVTKQAVQDWHYWKLRGYEL